MRFVIFGGGCYGTFYARQLLRARAAGAGDVGEILIVDHDPEPRARSELGQDGGLRFAHADWLDFLGTYLRDLEPDADDQLVTPPFTPHLALAWLLVRLRTEFPGFAWDLAPFQHLPGTPFQHQSSGGPLVVSHADWICPVHCIEPDVCPRTRGPRDWDMDPTAHRLAEQLADRGQPVDQVHLFLCHHILYGVGGYRAAAVPAAFADISRSVRDRRSPRRFLVGTVSRCHGALHLLEAAVGTDREGDSVPAADLSPLLSRADQG